MKKKSDKPMDEVQKSSKLQAIRELKDSMKEMAGENLKKVMVASSSKEGLEEGLEKAKDVVEDLPNGEEKPEEMVSQEEQPSEEVSEELSVEQLDELIKKLEEMKQQKLQG